MFNKTSKSLKSYFLDPIPNYNKTVLVAGITRSGTTWLSNLINFKNDHRFIFEPFHPLTFSEMNTFGYQPYFRPEEASEEFLKFANSVFRGKIRGERVDRYNTQTLYTRRIVKTVYGNLALARLIKGFQSIPVIYILRHPFAVAYSKLADTTNGRWEDLNDLLIQKDLMEDHLETYRAVLNSAKTPFEKHVTNWCAIVKTLRNQAIMKKMFVVFYEDLCNSPSVLEKIFNFLDYPLPECDMIDFNVPSQTTDPTKARVCSTERVKSWQTKFSGAEIDKGLEIIKEFSLNDIYSREALPLLKSDFL